MIFHCALLSITMFLQSSAGAANREQQIVGLKARAESGDVRAQVELGTAYATGDGVVEDDVEAIKWFRKAAEKREAAGEYSLGEMYLSGRGVYADLAEAVKWMRRAAEDGDACGTGGADVKR